MWHSKGPTFLYFIAHYYLILLSHNNIQRYRVPFPLVLLMSKITRYAMAQAVSHRPLTAEVMVRSKASPYDTCREQRGDGSAYL
jgi:hypothetical protein